MAAIEKFTFPPRPLRQMRTLGKQRKCCSIKNDGVVGRDRYSALGTRTHRQDSHAVSQAGKEIRKIP